MNVAGEKCSLCADAGFPNVSAAYKGTPAGMSQTGKAIPPMCWDHRNNRIPSFIRESRKPIAEVAFCCMCEADGEKVIATRETVEGDPVCEECQKALDAPVNKPKPTTADKPIPRGYEVFDGQNGDELIEIDKDRAVTLYKSGMSWSEVAKTLGVAQHRVYSACRKLIDCDRNVPPKIMATEAPQSAAPVATATPQSKQSSVISNVDHWEQALIDRRIALVDELLEVLRKLHACDAALQSVGHVLEDHPLPGI